MKITSLVPVVFICALIASKSICAAPLEKTELVQSRGGSNFHWYNIQDCHREAYGIIANYENHRPEIQSTLKQLFQSGQRRLRIGIYHSHNSKSGTVVTSTKNGLDTQTLMNLKNFLADIRGAGFAEVLFSLFPQGLNQPWSNTNFDDELYAENLKVITQARSALVESGIFYKLDLLNEGTPAPSQKSLIKYTKRLWSDYTKKFGKQDTVGFSIIGNSVERMGEMPEIYNKNYPYVFDLHIYTLPNQSIMNADAKFKSMGLAKEGWIIGETYYDDLATLTDMKAGIQTLSRKVFYVLQWPLTPQKSCSDVDVTPPLKFENFLKLGF